MSNSYEGVIVLGVPRSGTTLLRRLMNAHPAFICPPETNLLSGASRFLEEAEFAGGLSVGVIPGLAFAGFEQGAVRNRLREFLFSFWRDIRDKAGKSYWVEKTAVDVFHIDAIEALCADNCRYVCIVRHPLDVICSIADLTAKMQSYLPEIYQYVQRHRSPIDAYAQAWADGNARLARFVDEHPDWCIQIRYEDLVSTPATKMAEVCAFLNESTDCDALVARAMSDRSAAGLGDWKTYKKTEISSDSVDRHGELGQWTIARLSSVLNPMLDRFGYEKIGSAQSTDNDTERAQEFARLVASMKLSLGDQQPDE
ncbi:MAG: sulfotransferase [Sedimenticola sp.]